VGRGPSPQQGSEAARYSGAAVLERVGELPGGPELLRVAAARGDVELVGGATRDLLLGSRPRELDVVVGTGADGLARELADALGLVGSHAGLRTGAHERFGTAFLVWDGGCIDVATRRAESYPTPGALPQVRPGTPEEDLLRRDFTVNAIGVALTGARRGELRAPEHALEDLAEGRLRVLHERSFIEDPTRLLRLGRYQARLGFALEDATARLAAEALARGALASVSGARVGAELRLALAEPDPVATLAALDRLGILAAIDRRLGFDEGLARRGLAELPADGRPDLLLLSSLLLAAGQDSGADRAGLTALLDELEFPAPDRDRIVSGALMAPALASRIGALARPSELYRELQPAPLEAVALAAASDASDGGAATEAARRWLSELRNVRTRITGDDLIAAGVPAGPEIGCRLALVHDLRLDGELDDTREAQLQAALAAPAR
jgi:tRNA nucleotidyltransferase (CCA-adding enzyme)